MYSQIAANKRKTLILMVGFVGFITLLGWIIGRATGSPGTMLTMTVFAVIYALVSYWASAKITLKLTGAKPVAKADAPQLYRIVENLSITAGLPMPKVYLINDPAPNAFATGRNPENAVVAVTTGLMEILEDEELEGVIAHELSHVGNYDIRLMAVVIVLVTVVALVSDMFLRVMWWGGDDEDSGGSPVFALIGIALALISPLIASMMQLAVSRKREYLADASGVMLTRFPDGLARALAKIDGYKGTIKRAETATAHLYFANPLKGKGIAKGIANLFSTHPPIAERIAKLNEMGGQV